MWCDMKVLILFDSVLIQLSTIVESDHRNVLVKSMAIELLNFWTNCANRTAPQSSSVGTVMVCTGATRDFGRNRDISELPAWLMQWI
jgi:hypothetical protein